MNDESLVNCKLLSAELLKENAQKTRQLFKWKMKGREKERKSAG